MQPVYKTNRTDKPKHISIYFH